MFYFRGQKIIMILSFLIICNIQDYYFMYYLFNDAIIGDFFVLKCQASKTSN